MKKNISEMYYKDYSFITQGRHKCTGCAACVAICPSKCITMKYDDEGFAYPNIDSAACIKCKKCINICCSEIKKSSQCYIYAIQSLDNEVLKTSSSGGVFTELCRAFVKNGGYVSAALFDSDYMVKHIISNDLDELSRCRGAKYSQSDTSNVFQKLKKVLDDDKEVMFVGTPCQVAAAARIAGTNRNNLVTVSFVCHGVPSPAVWKRYLSEIEEKLGSKIISVEMRNKDMGWQSYSMKIASDKGNIYQEVKRKDIFLRGFLSELYLRPACYECNYKGEYNNADIVIADCWGVDKLELPFELSKGVSMVLTQSDKGESLLKEIKENILIYQIDGSILNNNKAYIFSALPHKNREKFFKQFLRGKKRVTKLIFDRCTPSIFVRIKKHLFRVLNMGVLLIF